MALLVADTSALVSLGTAAEESPSPLTFLLDEYTVLIPHEVEDELATTAAYNDTAGDAAQAVLTCRNRFTMVAASLDPTFPLDVGENAAIALANDQEAGLFFCDEFNEIGIVHASLTDTRLVTTPSLLRAFAKWVVCTAAEAETILDTISTARSWDSNRYAERSIASLDMMDDSDTGT